MISGKHLVWSVVLPSIVILTVIYGVNRTTEKTAYVNIGNVYDSFLLTKELNSKFETIKNQRQLILDSLRLHVDQLARALNNGEVENDKVQLFERMKSNYQYKQQEFDRDNDALMNNYNDQIMNQLNQYVADYGKNKGYTYIYGANGSGSIMYAKESNDISDKIIQYINDRYEGK